MTQGKLEIPGKTFREFFKTVSRVDSECRLYIENGRMHTKLVDAANVMLIDIEADLEKGLDAQASNAIGTSSPGVVMGISASHMVQLAKLIADTDLVIMTWEATNVDRLHRVSLKTNNYSAAFITSDEKYMRKEPRPPVIKTSAKFTVDSSRLAEFVDIATSACRITVRDMSVTFKATFDKGSYASITAKPASGEATCLYSADYIRDIAKSFPKQQIKAEFGTDRPLTACVKCGQLRVKWMLAPRIITDGDEDD